MACPVLTIDESKKLLTSHYNLLRKKEHDIDTVRRFRSWFFFLLNIVYICSSNRYMLTCYHSLIYWMITLFPYRLAITLFRLVSKQQLQLYFDVAFYKQSPIWRQKFNFTSLSQKDSQFASLNLLKDTDAYRTSFDWRYTKTVELSIWQSWKTKIPPICHSRWTDRNSAYGLGQLIPSQVPDHGTLNSPCWPKGNSLTVWLLHNATHVTLSLTGETLLKRRSKSCVLKYISFTKM